MQILIRIVAVNFATLAVRAARIQSYQLLNHLSHLNSTDAANSSEDEALSLDFTSTSNHLQLSHGHSQSFNSMREHHANYLLHKGAKVSLQEENASVVDLQMQTTIDSNTSATNHIGLEYPLAPPQSLLQTFQSQVNYLHSAGFIKVENTQMFGLISIGACGIALCLGCCCQKNWLHLSTPVEEGGRKQYTYKGRVIYEWEQTPSSIILYTQLPKGIKRNDVEVKIWPRNLKIAMHGKQPFIKEELFSVVDVNQSDWNISWNGELAVYLQKEYEDVEWPCVIHAHHPDKTASDD